MPATEWMILLIISNQDINQENIDKYKKIILNLLIDFKLKKIEVSKYNVKIDNNKVTTYLKTISPNIQLLKQKFLENNLDYKLFIDEITTELQWQELIFQIYSKKIKIDEKSFKAEIDELLKKKSLIEEYKISKIEIQSNSNDPEDQKKIAEIKKEINDDGFENVLLKYDETLSAANRGDLGWINSESLSSDIYKIVTNMKKGQVSIPIRKQNSIIFLKLEDKRMSKTDKKNIDKLKKKLLIKKKTNCSICTQEVMFQNLEIQVLLNINEEKNYYHKW